MPFGADIWSERIASVEDDPTRRSLLGEVGRWRAARLTDIQAARQSTYAMSRLHWLLRESDQAVREAHQLISLCQTPPRASSEDIDAAKGWMASMGAEVPKIVDVAPRRERNDKRPAKRERQRDPREERSGSLGNTAADRAIAHGKKGHWMAALKELKDRRPSARVDLVRAWLHLGKALELEDAEACRRELANLRDRMGERMIAGDRGARPERAERNERSKPARNERTKEPRSKADTHPGKAEFEAPKGPSPREVARKREAALRGHFNDGAVPEIEVLVPIIQQWDRMWRAIQAGERDPLSDAQVERLLVAVDTASDDDRTIPGGTSLALRTAAAGGELSKALLLNGTPAKRYGGEGIESVLELSSAAVAGGWRVDRVLRGPTRRETREHPALGTLGGAMNGLWRVLLRKEEARCELWFIAALSPEGRAGVPPLLLSDHKRVIALPIDPDLLGWYGTLDAPDAIGWTGDEGDALREALRDV